MTNGTGCSLALFFRQDTIFCPAFSAEQNLIRHPFSPAIRRKASWSVTVPSIPVFNFQVTKKGEELSTPSCPDASKCLGK